MKRFSMLFVILVTFSILLPTVHAQDKVPDVPLNPSTWMPDANLRTAVRNALGVANDDGLTQQAMTNLTELIARNASIANITGLEHATNLTKLDLRSNSISSITALSGLTNLRVLWLAFNNITDISSLSSLTNLTTLTLRDNQIDDITELESLTNLEVLWLKNCGITDVSPLLTLTNLTTLRIAGNTLTNAHLLGSLTNLSDIDITIPDPPQESTPQENTPQENTLQTPEDRVSPSVSLTVPSGAQNGAFDVTITFTEVVSDFIQSDLSLTGTATATITLWQTTDNTTYTATLTPTTSGTVILSVPAGVATDAASNPNIVSSAHTVIVDVDAPGVSVSVPSGVQNGQFSVTITFTESISSFSQLPLELVTNTAGATISSEHSVSANGATTSIIQHVTPTRSGEVSLRVVAGVASDAAGNTNTVSASQTVSIDMDAPGVSITVPSGNQTGAFDATITFTEAVSGFEQADLSITGTATASVTAWSANSENTVYTATITPTTSGTVILNIAAGVATDAVNNLNTAATSQTVTIDVDAPTVRISVPSDTQNGVFNATITFSEAVSGFEQSDLSTTGTATASVTAWSANTENTVYTATITPTTSGDVTLGVAAGVATDAANNLNAAATTQTVSVDVNAPGVSITVPSGDQTGAFDATITFTEAVSDFQQSDVLFTGTATASITAWSVNTDNTVYTATVTPTTNGEVTLSVAAGVATDAANNTNTAAASQTVTIIPDPATWMPDANLRSAVREALGLASNAVFRQDNLKTLTSLRAVQRQVTNLTGLEYATGLTKLVAWGNQISNVTPLENLTNLTDLRLGGSQISNVTPLEGLTALTHLALQHNNISNVTPLSKLVNLTWLRLAGNPVTDLSPLSGLASLTDADVEIPASDTEHPGVSITVPSGNQTGAFDATITFTEAVSGFEQSDVSLAGTATASITAWSANTDNTVYTATITPTTSGTVILEVAAEVATDAANNLNTAATSQTVTIDVDAPAVTIDVPSDAQNGAFNVTITFTEVVSDFVQSDMSLTGTATASVTAWSANTDNTVYTATVAPTSSGEVIFSIASGVAMDAANNQNTAATSQTVTVDVDAPSVSVSVPSGIQNSAFDATIAFSEPVSDFDQTDVNLTGNASASITAWSANTENSVYTATIAPTTSGEVTVGIAAGVAMDIANNTNTAATSQTVRVDIDKPAVTLTMPSGMQNSVFEVLIRFTEAVSGFTQSDVSISGTANASITAWNTSDNITYTATITPTTSGEVTLSVAANIAIDVANNPNTAATSQTVHVDVDAPSVSISVPSDDQTGAFNVTITFTESISGFAQGNVSVSGTANASITAWNTTDDTTFTATITPSISGKVSLSIPANVAVDTASNPNTASTTQTVTVFVVQLSQQQVVQTVTLNTDAQEVVDTDPPGVSIEGPETPQNGAFEVTITFTEAVSGFEQSDIYISNASITAWTNTDDTVYTATITPKTSGYVILSIAAGVATDAANNQNTRTELKTVVVDMDPPSVGRIVVPDSRVPQNGPFDVRIGFTEAVTFVPDKISLTGSANATVSQFQGRPNVYTATVTPTTSGHVLINIPAGFAIDKAGNPTTNSDTTRSVPVDVDPPSVVIAVPDGVQPDAFDVTITFSEADSIAGSPPQDEVVGFDQGDISFTGSTADLSVIWFSRRKSDVRHHDVYNVRIKPTTSGEAVINVPAGVATDAGGNGNTAAIAKTVTVDVDKPTVTIDVPSETQAGAFDATITFNEAVSGFAPSDVSLTGSAANITGWRSNSDNTVYTAAITSIASGTVSISIPAGVATDAAGNENIAATPQTVTIDIPEQSGITGPMVNISVPSGVQNGAFDVIVTFSSAVSDFAQSELILTGSASITSWSANTENTDFTATVTPTASGNIMFSVAANVATDAANNQNTAAMVQTVIVDVDLPSVELVLLPEVKNNRIDVQITFTEPVEGFESTDLSITTNGLTALDPTVFDNGQEFSYPITSITGWRPSQDKTTYTAYITTYSKTKGQVIVEIPASVATDAAGNFNIAGDALTVDKGPAGDLFGYSGGGNVGWVDAKVYDYSNSACYSFGSHNLRGRLDVNEDDSIDEDDVAMVRDALGQFGDGIVHPRTDVTCDGAVDDDDLALVDDTEGSTVTISVPTGTQPSAFYITIKFNEAVFNFEDTDISLADSTATATAKIMGYFGAVDGTGSVTYSVRITPTTDGNVVIRVPAGAAEDSLGNLSTASDTHTVTVNMGVPTVSISFTGLNRKEPDPQNPFFEYSEDEALGPFNAIITFSEAVSGFDQTDVSLKLRDGATATITAWNTTDSITYTATITPTVNGGLYVSIPAGVATDADDNSNAASDSYAIHVNLPEDDGNAPPAALSRVIELLDTTPLESLDPDMLETQLQILRAESDGSLKYLKAIALVERVLASLRPGETRLLANYPNPFNPETWIPYELANSSDVQITIYDMRGTVVRQLDLGHQLAGYYTSRSRAAYWDGQNDFGENVASGIYFYQLEADNMSLLRKMIILK